MLGQYRALQLSLNECAAQNGWHSLTALIREAPLTHQADARHKGDADEA